MSIRGKQIVPPLSISDLDLSGSASLDGNLSLDQGTYSLDLGSSSSAGITTIGGGSVVLDGGSLQFNNLTQDNAAPRIVGTDASGVASWIDPASFSVNPTNYWQTGANSLLTAPINITTNGVLAFTQPGADQVSFNFSSDQIAINLNDNTTFTNFGAATFSLSQGINQWHSSGVRFGTVVAGGNNQIDIQSSGIGFTLGGSLGTAGQVLTSDGTVSYWSTIAGATPTNYWQTGANSTLTSAVDIIQGTYDLTIGSIGDSGNVALSSATGVYLASGDDIGVQSVGDTQIASQGTLTLATGTVGAPPFPAGMALLSDTYLVGLAATMYLQSTNAFYLTSPAIGLTSPFGSLGFTAGSSGLLFGSPANTIEMTGATNNIIGAGGALSINVSDPAASLRFIGIDPGTPATANEFLTLDTGNNVVLAAVPSSGVSPTNYWQTGNNSVLTAPVQIDQGSYNLTIGNSSGSGRVFINSDDQIQLFADNVYLLGENLSMYTSATTGFVRAGFQLSGLYMNNTLTQFRFWNSTSNLINARNSPLVVDVTNASTSLQLSGIASGTPATAGDFLTLDASNNVVLATAGGATPTNYWQTGANTSLGAAVVVDQGNYNMTIGQTSSSGLVYMYGSVVAATLGAALPGLSIFQAGPGSQNWGVTGNNILTHAAAGTFSWNIGSSGSFAFNVGTGATFTIDQSSGNFTLLGTTVGTPATANRFLTVDSSNNVIFADASGGGATPTNYWQTGANSTLTTSVTVDAGKNSLTLQTDNTSITYALNLDAGTIGITGQAVSIGGSANTIIGDGTGGVRINTSTTGLGTAGQVLTSDGTNVYWSTPSGGGATPTNYWQTGANSVLTSNVTIDQGVYNASIGSATSTGLVAMQTNGLLVLAAGGSKAGLSMPSNVSQRTSLTDLTSILISAGNQIPVTSTGLNISNSTGYLFNMQSTGADIQLRTITSGNIILNATEDVYINNIGTGTPATANTFLTLDANDKVVLATASGGGGGFSTSSKGIDNNGTDIYLGGQLAASDSILIDGNTNTSFYIGSSANTVSDFGVYFGDVLKFVDPTQATNTGIEMTGNILKVNRFNGDSVRLQGGIIEVFDNTVREVVLGGTSVTKLQMRNTTGPYTIELSANTLGESWINTSAGVNIGDGADGTALPTNSLLNVVGGSISTSTAPTLVSGYSYVGRDNTTGVFGTFTPSSDERLKKSVMPIGADFALDIIRDIQPVTFEWDLDKMPGNDDSVHFGFIAQNVKDAHENLVHNTFEKDGVQYIGVKDKEIAAILLSAVKELDKRLTELES